jgi:DNA-binding winged helix-turn-helix (wHTH) protein/tetratricopeptide (TPR) repeat protein
MGTVEPVRLRFGEFELDEGNARLLRSGTGVPLAPKALAVLCALARRPGQLLTKNALLDEVWGHQHVSESVLKTLISELRAALADDAKQPRYIETASRKGYRFIGAAAPDAAPPLVPPMAHAELQTPMVGRRDALAQVRAAWQRALAGKKQLVWVVGEAGVGKTTLIDALLREVDPTMWIRGQCVEQFGAGEPYLPVLEALAVLCRHDKALPALLRSAAPTWLLQLPWLCTEAERAELRRELAGATQERMLRELRTLFDEYSAQRPMLFVIEDLHWSDEATLRMMDYFIRTPGRARIMWLVTFRLAEVISGEHLLKAMRNELRLHKLAEEIVLDPFSESEVADYVGQRFSGREFSEGFVRKLHAHTDGLPLFLVNVVDEIVSQGAPQRADAAEPALEDLAVPEGLAGVLEKQMSRLPAAQRAALEAASVCGMEFRPLTVAAALEADVATVGDCCEALARQRLWLTALDVGRRPDGSIDARYAFRHALYKRVLYQGVGAATRVQMHRRVALSMERSLASGVAVTAAELASHFELSHEIPMALRYYAEAAENALRSFAPKEAVQLTSHALELLKPLPEGAERDELEMNLTGPRGVATSQLLGIASPEARATFARAEVLTSRLPPAPKRAFEMSGLGWVHYVRGEFEQARALATRTLALGDARDDPLLRIAACNLMGVTVGQQGELAASRRWLERGLEICAQVGEQIPIAPFVIDPIVSIRANLYLFLANLGYPDQALRQLEAAMARAAAIGQPMAQMLSHWCNGIAGWRVEDGARLERAADGIDRTVVGNMLAQGEGPGHWIRGWRMALHGDPAAAYERIMKGYERHERFGMYAGCPIVLGYAAEALRLAQRPDEAQQRIEQALAMGERIGDRVYIPDLFVLKARIADARDDRAGARAAIDAALREARAQQALWPQLVAHTERCAMPDATAADREALAACCALLTEGLDTPVMQRARNLLG